MAPAKSSGSGSGKPKKAGATPVAAAAGAAAKAKKAAAAASPKAKGTPKGKGKGASAKAKAPQPPSSSSAVKSGPAKEDKAGAGSKGSSGKGKGKGSGSSGDNGGGPRFFLMKSEPDTFSIQQLASLPNQISCWEGVRNYQARNIMRDQMRVGDKAFFYHSSCKVPGIVGLIEIVKTAYPDHFQFDKASPYYDAAASPENPRWLMVDVQLKETLPNMVTLEELRAEAAKPQSPLQGMLLLQRGSRLSVQPVKPAEWEHINDMIDAKRKQEDKGPEEEA